jgi:diaminohydroxyphosphoribosylaminopyrimidine deaminase / 5-amino-6-(5-phosphoribosylamino)uracil reductase
MQEALGLAATAIGVSEPNPRVGCVIGRADGSVLGRGATQQVGGPHAEVMALRDAQTQGHDVRGATVWVTLEPCAHHGRTPPCCDALIAAGLGRVVVAVQDPFSQVAGAGLARLRAAGIDVVMAESQQATAARELNIGFFSRYLRQRPWVRLKMASSLDGRTALPDGRSQWITGPLARADGHAFRKRASAVLTGIGTVLADNPRLDVRHVPTQLQPLRVLLDSALRVPTTAALFSPLGAVLVVGAHDAGGRAAALHEAGAEVILLPGRQGQVDLRQLLAELTRRSVNELHVEAGPRLSAAWIVAGLVDELLLYQAPMLLGAGRDMLAFGPVPQLNDAPRFDFYDIAPVGPDLRILARAAQPTGVGILDDQRPA